MSLLNPSTRIVGICVAALSTIPTQTAQSQGAAAVIEYQNPTTVHRVSPRQMRFQVGGADGVEFYRITAVVPRSDGAFVVANAGTNELRLFDSTGALQWSVGRSGKGPGEYSHIQDAAGLPGDSTVVFDPVARRITVLDPQGDFVRSFQLAAPFEGGGTPTGVVALRNGTLLVGYSEIQRMAPQPTAVYFGQRFFRYSATGELQSPEGLPLPESEHFVQAVPPTMGGVAYWDLAFGRRMTIRADSNWVLTGDGTAWTVEQRTPDGVVRKVHRLARPTEPVTAQDREAYREQVVESSQATQRAVAERMASEMPYPRTKPAYRRFAVDDLGRLWLEAYSSQPETGTLWVRLDPPTQTAVALHLPPRYRPFAFRADLVYGVWRDSDDVEHVQVFAVDGS